MTLGDKILYYREMLGMSQHKLAVKSNITASAICNYELGKRKPELEAFIRICKAFGVTTDTFLKDVDLDVEINEIEEITLQSLSEKIETLEKAFRILEDYINRYVAKRENSKSILDHEGDE